MRFIWTKFAGGLNTKPRPYLYWLAGLCLVCSLLFLLRCHIRQDVQQELHASTHLANVLLQIGQLRHTATHSELAALQHHLSTEQQQWRHLQIILKEPSYTYENKVADFANNINTPPAWLMSLFGLESLPATVITLPNGAGDIYLQADPYAELAEALQESLGFMLALMVFLGLGSLLLRSWAAQRRLSQCLLRLQENERRELARELHDEFGQMLTAMNISTAYLQRHAEKLSLAQIRSTADELSSDVRHLASQVKALLSQLRPHGLSGLGLLSSLHDLLATWRQRAPHITWSAEWPQDLPSLSAEQGLTVYRCVQEALTNVVRHSGATACQIVLKQSNANLQLTIDDNGSGRKESIQHHVGNGLLGMRERLLMAGGDLRFSNRLPQGISLHVTLPLQASVPLTSLRLQGEHA